MTFIFSRAGIAATAVIGLLAGAGVVADRVHQGPANGWPYGTPQGFSRQVQLTDISGNTPMYSSVFPQVAVDPADPDVVAVAWRQYTLPVNVTADEGQNADCHVSVSTDGGQTYTDTDLMPNFRTSPPAAALNLWYCNAPWATFGPDGTLYAGGSVYTPGTGTKQGRVMVTVSHDDGKTWSPGTWGINLANFAPGLTGLNGGTAPEDTPWDGADGFVDQQTGTLYTESTSNGSYIVASNDKGSTFGTVYQPSVPGWTVPTHQAVGTASLAFGVLAVPVAASSTPIANETCPCLALWTSTNEGASFTPHFIAPGSGFNATGTVRFPISAADPQHKGHYAIAVYTPDHLLPKIYYTDDSGSTWRSAVPAQPNTGGTVVQASQVGLGYSTTGQLLITWRGFYREAYFFQIFRRPCSEATASSADQSGQPATVGVPCAHLSRQLRRRKRRRGLHDMDQRELKRRVRRFPLRTGRARGGHRRRQDPAPALQLAGQPRGPGPGSAPQECPG